MSEIDFSKYYAKHCARYYGWLPAGIAYQKQVRKKSLKYFTLCGRKAYDIFMFEQAGVLSRDRNERLPNVFICERDNEAVPEILDYVRPPLSEAIIPAPLEQILTFEDNEHTRGRSPDEDERNRHIREMLRIKGWAQQLESLFPFDVINFDAYGNLLNPDDESNKLLYQSFERIFELQKLADTFLLFVTTPITHIHPDLHSRFACDLELNANEHPGIHEALLSRLETISYDDIDGDLRTAFGFAKSIVLSAARSKGWNGEHKGIYIYENDARRKMLSSVVQFSRAQTLWDQSVYVADIVRVIEEMPEYYSYEESLKDQDVKKHLDGVIKYREETQRLTQ